MRSYPTTGFYFDKRRPLKDNKFPLKLRVSFQRVTKNFDIDFSMTEEEYETVFGLKSPRGHNKTLKDRLSLIEQKAMDIIKNLKVFSFEEFENLFYQKRIDSENLVFYFLNRIKEFELNGQLSSAESYVSALNKLYFTLYPAKSSIEEKAIKKNQSYKPISFEEVSVEKLNEIIRKWNSKKMNPTTQGIFLRNLRAILNIALKHGKITKELYPFGKDKIQIQNVQKAKKHLTYEELKKLIDFKPAIGSAQEIALDFWFLSFYLCGININDILTIKFKDFHDDHIFFIRNKTKRTSEIIDQQRITIIQKANDIINKYKSPISKNEEYLFPFLSTSDDPLEQRKKIKNFTRMINQHMKKIVQILNINKPVTTYFARHTFASIAVDKNVPLIEIQNALGHTDIKTTQNYLSSMRPAFGEDFYSNIFNN